MVVLPTWRGPATSTAPNMEANSVTVRSACLFMYIKAHPFGWFNILYYFSRNGFILQEQPIKNCPKFW